MVEDFAPPKRDDNTLYIGMDLGTLRSVIMTSAGYKKMITTVIGTPRDAVAKNFLKANVLFGEEALANRLALNLYRPLEWGVIKDNTEDKKAIQDFIRYMIKLAEPERFERVFGVIGAPAESSFVDAKHILEAAMGSLDAHMVISEPFAIAYACNKLKNTLVIDIGAGTADFCRVYGTIPKQEDQITLTRAGDHIDNVILDEIKKKYSGAQVTKDMVRKWKEKWSFVTTPRESPITVTFSIQGKAQELDITECIRKGCESILPEYLEAIKTAINEANPEFQEDFRANVLLAGGGSGIHNLAERLKHELEDIGDCEIFLAADLVDDHDLLVAQGALNLAMNMPERYWEKLI
jgi:rod shape-determining protein MreB